MNDSSGSHEPDAAHARLVGDLQRRIDALLRANESDFGEFTRGDWLVCVGGFLILPYLMFLWFAP